MVLESAEFKRDFAQACETFALLPGVSRESTSAWLFGSRAARCGRPASDWDVLFILPQRITPRRTRIGCLDVVVVDGTREGRRAWLSGELAAHVAVYGEPIWGDEDWRKSIDVRAASQGKLLRTIARAARLQTAWRNLTSFHRVHRAATLRLDAQRVDWLAHRGTVPPTAHLQDEWLRLSQKERERCLAPLSVGVGHLKDVLLADGA